MRFKVTTDEEIKQAVRAGLKENGFYCPCILDSFGKEEYKCPCKDFKENVPVGEYCHCGLYLKEEE